MVVPDTVKVEVTAVVGDTDFVVDKVVVNGREVEVMVVVCDTDFVVDKVVVIDMVVIDNVFVKASEVVWDLDLELKVELNEVVWGLCVELKAGIAVLDELGEEIELESCFCEVIDVLLHVSSRPVQHVDVSAHNSLHVHTLNAPPGVTKIIAVESSHLSMHICLFVTVVAVVVVRVAVPGQ